jgi:hypothetical protein
MITIWNSSGSQRQGVANLFCRRLRRIGGVHRRSAGWRRIATTKETFRSLAEKMHALESAALQNHLAFLHANSSSAAIMRLLVELHNLGVSGDENMRLMQRWNQPDLPHHTTRSLEQLRKEIATVRAINIAIEARDTEVSVPNEKIWEAVRQIGVGREEVKWLKKRWLV